PVVAMHSTAAEIDAGLVLRGRTEAVRVVEVRAETSGRVISKPLRKGAFVREGDPLCQLDPGTRHADLSEAEARLAEARINYNAATKLAKEGFASSTREASARAQLQSAEAAVERARREIERLTMRAPFEGYLESDTAELGLLLQPGASCATVIQLDPIKMVGFVPEKEIDRVRPGAPARARLITGRELAGTVSFIARSSDPETRTFRVEVTIPNPDLAVRDGQTAEIVIATAATRAHLVPSSALTLDDEGRLGVRVVDADSRARFVPLRVVRDTPRGFWVTGLPDEADVIVVGQEYVTDGAPVLPSFKEATQ
ncbi:MAG: efflux RND transporter periplasmic adaptor subunit, partial [Alphaproteobacteria bacterium]